MNASPLVSTAVRRPHLGPPLPLLGIWLAVGTAAAFLVPLSGEGFADLQGYRAVFIHVPFAWAGSVAFLAAAGYGVRYLVRRRLLDDLLACGAAEVGLVMLVLATGTGMIFARTQWGTYWNWDPRQTSVFFVMLLYAAYLALRGALPEDDALRARLSAAYLLLAAPVMVWLVGVFPRLERVKTMSLHPVQAPFDAVHWQVMLFNFVGLLGLLWLLVAWHGGIGRLRLAARERW